MERGLLMMKKPEIAESVCVAPGAQIIGDVRIGERSSVWYNAVLRGDCGRIVIGKETNLQDGVIVHCSKDAPVTVGDGVTVGHGAILHSCTVGNGTLVGMGAIVLDGAVIGQRCLVGAGALVTPGSVIPDGTLAVGAPARVKRELTEEETEGLKENAEEYVGLAEEAGKEEI